MCTADVTPMVLHLKSNASDGLALDFGTKHKCRNFDKVRKWEDENRATDLDVSFERLFNV